MGNINLSKTFHKMSKALPFKNLKPLLNRVLIAKPEMTKMSKGGIILKKEEEVSWGTVVSVGPGRPGEDGKLMPMSLKVGDNVLLPSYGGNTVKLHGDKELSIYRDDEIVGILDEKEVV